MEKINVKIDEEKTDKRLIQILKELKIQIINKGKNNSNTAGKENEIISEITIEGEELQKLKQAETREESYENLVSNTKYEIKITAKVSLGETIEEVQTTYNLREFITLKQRAEVQMRNLFVTGDMIDFDVRIEDIDNASLTGEVRMELRDEKRNLIKLEYIYANKEYERKTFEKLELNKTYTLSFYANQYNEGSTDSTYKPNYLLKQLEIYTEIGITGSIGLTDLTRKATGKNLVDMSSEIKWYVYPNFNTSDYYGKEYDSNTKTLTLGGYGNNRRAVYDLQEYAGQIMTISFKAKLTEKGSSGNSIVYIQNKKTDGNRTKLEGVSTGEWKEFSYTMQLDASGYLGFYIQGGNGIEIQELQIELGSKKTQYEEYRYALKSDLIVNLKDMRNEISTKEYYIRIYENNQIIEKNCYKEITEKNEVKDAVKQYDVKKNNNYKVELFIVINEREYVLDSLEFDTVEGEEIKGIRSKEEFLEIQPKGRYIVLTDIDLSGGKNNQYRFGYDVNDALVFNGSLDFNGYTLTRDSANIDYNISSEIFCKIGTQGIIKNLVFNVKMNNIIELSRFKGLVYNNSGTIQNIMINLIESTPVPNIDISIIGNENSGKLDNFVVNLDKSLYGSRSLTLGFSKNTGSIQNGYLVGKNIKIVNVMTSNNRNTGGIVVNNQGLIKNIYGLINVDIAGESNQEIVGNLVASSSGMNSRIENVYSVGNGERTEENLSMGPTVGQVYEAYQLKNIYYFSDTVFQNNYNTKSTELALYDKNFQNQILNSDAQFDVSNLVERGYYPHLIMPTCMPAQNYIALPEVKNEDLPDILSTEVLDQSNEKVKVKMTVNNPSGETITSIKMKDINCDILSQEYQEGRSEVIAELNQPVRYISSYYVLSITTKGAYNLSYTRDFKENERIINIELYREIYTIEDWKKINRSPTENYKIMEDLDFINAGKDICINNGFTGKIDGQNHTISNITMSEDRGGVFLTYFSGELKNLFIKNYNHMAKNQSYIGFIAAATKNAKINNVHISEIKIIVENVEYNMNIGGLIGRNNGAKVENSSVIDCTVIVSNCMGINVIGGMIGEDIGGTINNSFAHSLDIQVNRINSNGVGGIVGAAYTGSSNFEIKNCYAEGKIRVNSNSNYLGGILGYSYAQNFKMENCFSKVNLCSDGDRIGGIIGVGANMELDSNLSMGNIYYSKQTVSYAGRMVEKMQIEGRNYAYQGQLINGYQINELLGASGFLTKEELKRKDTYFTKLQFENAYNYEQIAEEILPKLYNTEKTELLPGQKDIKIDENQDLGIEEVEVEKLNENTISVRVQINNQKEVCIVGIEIEEMEVTNIVQNITENKKTYITLIAKPNRYYDTYLIKTINYQVGEQEKRKEVQVRINIQLYKEIYSYEDWQSIEIGTYQNYRLMNDIDFEGKENIKNNVTLARLETDGKQRSIKNIVMKLDSKSSGLIQDVSVNIENIHFESIEIQNLGIGSHTGIIVSTMGNICSSKFSNIIINAPNMSHVGIIAENRAGFMIHIQMDEVKCIGQSFVGGLIGNGGSGGMDSIEGDHIEVIGSGNYVGGIVGNWGNGGSNVTLKNSFVTGRDNVGGIGGFCRNLYSTGENLSVIGRENVGGLIGRYTNAKSSYQSIKYSNIKGITNVGSIVGKSTGVVNSTVMNVTLEVEDINANNIGGISGENSTSEIMNNQVTDLKILSQANNVGGIVGYSNSGTIAKNYIKNGTIKGNCNIGGFVGNHRTGKIENNYHNLEIIGINQNIGGMIGFLDNTNMTAVENTSYLSQNYIAGAKVSGQKNVGGIIGNKAEEISIVKDFYCNNFVEANIESIEEETTSILIGSSPKENKKLKNTYVYQYSTVNGKNITQENEPDINTTQYLKEVDLKQESTYKAKLGWGTNYLYTTLPNGKYPIISGLANQEGIDLPKDSEHIVNAEAGITTLSLEEAEELQETFEYNGKKIETYETYSIVTDQDGTSIKREERLYVKEGKLYVIDGQLEMVTNNLIVDSYNGKEYETILGTDGKLYDLKDRIHYPENFRNEKIKTIGNNLHQEKKEITVTYENGSKVTFNYQTGEVIEEQKVENNTSLLSYLKEQLGTESNLVENTEESYEENKTLIGKLQITSIEKAMELKNSENINNTVEEQTENTTNSSNETSSITSTNRGSYITVYNNSKKEFEVYKEEEILDVKNEEVVSQNEKIEKNNLNEYYVQEERTEKETSGIVWVLLSITGAIIVLFVLWKRR